MSGSLELGAMKTITDLSRLAIKIDEEQKVTDSTPEKKSIEEIGKSAFSFKKQNTDKRKSFGN